MDTKQLIEAAEEYLRVSRSGDDEAARQAIKRLYDALMQAEIPHRDNLTGLAQREAQ